MRPPPLLADPVDATRVRPLPRPCAWGDRRRRDRLRVLSLEEIARLLVLPLASDQRGLSVWADAPIARTLPLREGDVITARVRLVARGWIASRSPLDQLPPREARPAEPARA